MRVRGVHVVGPQGRRGGRGAGAGGRGDLGNAGRGARGEAAPRGLADGRASAPRAATSGERERRPHARGTPTSERLVPKTKGWNHKYRKTLRKNGLRFIFVGVTFHNIKWDSRPPTSFLPSLSCVRVCARVEHLPPNMSRAVNSKCSARAGAHARRTCLGRAARGFFLPQPRWTRPLRERTGSAAPGSGFIPAGCSTSLSRSIGE